MTLIPDPKESEVESYLKKVLRSSQSSTSSIDQVNGSAADSRSNSDVSGFTLLARYEDKIIGVPRIFSRSWCQSS